jgi:hypothetical protein
VRPEHQTHKQRGAPGHRAASGGRGAPSRPPPQSGYRLGGHRPHFGLSSEEASLSAMGVLVPGGGPRKAIGKKRTSPRGARPVSAAHLQWTRRKPFAGEEGAPSSQVFSLTWHVSESVLCLLRPPGQASPRSARGFCSSLLTAAASMDPRSPQAAPDQFSLHLNPFSLSSAIAANAGASAGLSAMAKKAPAFGLPGSAFDSPTALLSAAVSLGDLNPRALGSSRTVGAGAASASLGRPSRDFRPLTADVGVPSYSAGVGVGAGSLLGLHDVASAMELGKGMGMGGVGAPASSSSSSSGAGALAMATDRRTSPGPGPGAAPGGGCLGMGMGVGMGALALAGNSNPSARLGGLEATLPRSGAATEQGPVSTLRRSCRTPAPAHAHVWVRCGAADGVPGHGHADGGGHVALGHGRHAAQQAAKGGPLGAHLGGEAGEDALAEQDAQPAVPPAQEDVRGAAQDGGWGRGAFAVFVALALIVFVCPGRRRSSS